jgi:uncharacterized protein YcaQ
MPLLERLENRDGWSPRTTLLSPFDNLICDRARTKQVFGFDYRVEIYVPPARRRYGYYAMPVLHGERLIGRVDPAMDRRSGRLTIKSIHHEPGSAWNRSVDVAVEGAVEGLGRFLGATDIAWPPGWQVRPVRGSRSGGRR